MIGIVGPPGAGKTTIAQLLGRYYDVSGGRITIDGQDIREITLASLRDAVSIVQQEPFLFTASLNHNVAYGAPWAVRPDIEHSAQTAQLHNYICGLPDSYNTLVGERGVSPDFAIVSLRNWSCIPTCLCVVPYTSCRCGAAPAAVAASMLEGRYERGRELF